MTSNRLPDGPGGTANPERPERETSEDSRLDDAMRRADDLLVDSLRRDEQERRKRRTRRVALAALGGLVMTTLAVIALSALLAGPPGQGTKASNDPLDQAAALNQQGWALWQKGELSEAEAKFAEAVKLDPDYSVAWNGLGWARFNGGNYAKAEEAFLKAVETDDSNAAALNGLGQLYYTQNKLDKSEEYLLKAAPNAPAAWWGLARLYLFQGNYAEAQKWAQKVADSGDKSIEPLLAAAKAKSLPDDLKAQIAPPTGTGDAQAADEVQRGWKLWNQGRGAQARKVFEEYLKQHPDDANALNGLGWSLITTNKPAEAQAQFEKALKIDPAVAGAMNGLARALKAQGKTDEAIKVWEDMVKKVPGVHAGTYGLADAYLEKKQYQKAAELYEQIAQQQPNDPEVQKKLETAQKGAAG